jgi:hypothetical protein
MTTLPPQPINTSMGATQMSTPLSSLPLKTTSSDNTSEIDDPLIQGVLKEFEEVHSQNNQPPPQQQYTVNIKTPEQPPQISMQQQLPIQSQQHAKNELNYNDPKKIVDIEIIKKSAILTAIIYLLQYTNILKIITTRLPETFKGYITGKELFINVALMFIVVYGIFYLGLV